MSQAGKHSEQNIFPVSCHLLEEVKIRIDQFPNRPGARDWTFSFTPAVGLSAFQDD